MASMHRTAYFACLGLPVLTNDISSGSKRLQTQSQCNLYQSIRVTGLPALDMHYHPYHLSLLHFLIPGVKPAISQTLPTTDCCDPTVTCYSVLTPI